MGYAYAFVVTEFRDGAGLAMGAEAITAGNLLFTFWIGGGLLLLLFLRHKEGQ